MFYNTQCAFGNRSRQFTLTEWFRPSPLRRPHVSTKSSRVKRDQQHHSLFSNHGMSLHRETSAMGFPYSAAIMRIRTSPYHQRFALLTIKFPEIHDERIRKSTLFSMRNATARKDGVNSLKPILSKTARRHRGWNWQSGTQVSSPMSSTFTSTTMPGGYERFSPATPPHRSLQENRIRRYQTLSRSEAMYVRIHIVYSQ